MLNTLRSYGNCWILLLYCFSIILFRIFLFFCSVLCAWWRIGCAMNWKCCLVEKLPLWGNAYPNTMCIFAQYVTFNSIHTLIFTATSITHTDFCWSIHINMRHNMDLINFQESQNVYKFVTRPFTIIKTSRSCVNYERKKTNLSGTRFGHLTMNSQKTLNKK